MRSTTTSLRRFFLIPACMLALGATACGTTAGTAASILGADITAGADTGIIGGQDSTAADTSTAGDVAATTDIATTQDTAAPEDTAAPVEPACAKKSTVSKGVNMKPGEACIACHTQKGEGAFYTIAGTVYATPHVINDCVTTVDYANTHVEVKDANGTIINLPVNSVGNFYYSKTVPAPYTVRVVRGTDSMDMVDPPPSGDCNSCHTTAGLNKAPGRIQAP